MSFNASVLDNIPMGQPPPGVVSNFVNPVTRKQSLRISIYAALPTMILFMILRLYTRARITKKWGADDFFVIVSAILITVYCGITFYLLEGPLGVHEWDVPLSHVHLTMSTAGLAAQCLFGVTSAFVKVSLLVLYLRLFKPTARSRTAIWVGIIVIVVFYIAATTALGIEYGRVNKATLSSISTLHARAIPLEKSVLIASLALGIVGMSVDFYLLVIPMHMIIGLRLPLGRKIGVCAIFMTGFLACLCSVIGVVYRYKLTKTTDQIWVVIPPYLVAILELNIGIICNCMPVVFVLFKGWTKRERCFPLIKHFKALTRRIPSRSKTEKIDSGQHMDLPTIPKPTMTGLRSFIHGFHASQLRTMEPPSHNQLSQLSSIDSSNDEYYTHLKAIR